MIIDYLSFSGFLDDDDYGPPKHSTHSSTKASSSSKLAKSSKRDYDYGSTQPRNPLFDVEMSERSERSGRGRSDSDYGIFLNIHFSFLICIFCFSFIIFTYCR